MFKDVINKITYNVMFSHFPFYVCGIIQNQNLINMKKKSNSRAPIMTDVKIKLGIRKHPKDYTNEDLKALIRETEKENAALRKLINSKKITNPETK